MNLITEVTRREMLKRTEPKQHTNAKKYRPKYLGVKRGTTLEFTCAGVKTYKQLIRPLLMKKYLAGKVTSRKLVNGDLKVRCTCPAFQYQGYAYIVHKSGASLKRETRKPDVRNPKQEGYLCKHLTAVLKDLPKRNKQIDVKMKPMNEAVNTNPPKNFDMTSYLKDADNVLKFKNKPFKPAGYKSKHSNFTTGAYQLGKFAMHLTATPFKATVVGHVKESKRWFPIAYGGSKIALNPSKAVTVNMDKDGVLELATFMDKYKVVSVLVGGQDVTGRIFYHTSLRNPDGKFVIVPEQHLFKLYHQAEVALIKKYGKKASVSTPAAIASQVIERIYGLGNYPHELTYNRGTYTLSVGARFLKAGTNFQIRYTKNSAGVFEIKGDVSEKLMRNVDGVPVTRDSLLDREVTKLKLEFAKDALATGNSAALEELKRIFDEDLFDLIERSAWIQRVHNQNKFTHPDEGKTKLPLRDKREIIADTTLAEHRSLRNIGRIAYLISSTQEKLTKFHKMVLNINKIDKASVLFK